MKPAVSEEAIFSIGERTQYISVRNPTENSCLFFGFSREPQLEFWAIKSVHVAKMCKKYVYLGTGFVPSVCVCVCVCVILVPGGQSIPKFLCL